MRVLVTGATGLRRRRTSSPALVAAGTTSSRSRHDAARIAARDGEHARRVDLARPLEPDALPSVDAIVHLAQANVPFPDGARELFAVNTASDRSACSSTPAPVGARALRLRLVGLASTGSASAASRRTTELGADDFYAATKIDGGAARRRVRARLVGTTVAAARRALRPGPDGRG